MKLMYRGIIFTIFVLLGAACGPTPTPPTPTPEPGPSQVWITTPASGVTLPMAPVGLEFEGASFVGVTEFEIRVNGSVDATVAPLGSSSCGANCGTKFFGEYLWTPPGIGTYTIALRALGNGQYSQSVEINIKIENVVEVEPGEEIPALPTPTPILPLPEAELPVLPTSTPLPEVIIPEKVIVTGLQNANCREGGGNEYEIVDTLMKDQSAEAIAMSEDGFYVKIIGPYLKIECWVWIRLVNVEQGDIKSLPVLSYPPLPEQQQPASSKPTATPVGKP